MELFCKNWGWVGGLGLFPPWFVWVWFCWAKKGEITQLGSPHNCGCYSSLIESKDMTATHHFQKHFCAISCVSRHHAEMRRRYHSRNHDAQIAIPIVTTLQAMEAGVLQIAAAISDHLITGVSTQLLWWAINQPKPLASNWTGFESECELRHSSLVADMQDRGRAATNDDFCCRLIYWFVFQSVIIFFVFHLFWTSV